MNLTKTAALILSSVLLSGAVVALEVVDINNDGVITTDEVTAARDSAKVERLAQFDTDGDGELSDDERDAAKAVRQEAALAAFDTDENGELSQEERQEARASRRSEFEASFDLDGDAELSETEQANLNDVVEEIRETRQENTGGGSRDGSGRGSKGSRASR